MTNAVIDVLEIGRLYWVGLEYPASLNDGSPTLSRQPPVRGRWFTDDAEASLHSPKNCHRHIALVVGLNASSGIAVLLLSTSQPRQPHRYLPWEGTLPLPGQPRHHVITEPSGAHILFPGHLNFTHAVAVTILSVNSIPGDWHGVVPGVCSFRDHRSIEVRVPDAEIDIIKALYSAYWAGVRYDCAGVVQEDDGEVGDGEGDGNGDGDAAKFLAEEQVLTRLALSLYRTEVSDQDDPIEPISGKRTSVIFKEISEGDEIRNVQLDLMKQGFERGAYDPPLLKAVFYSIWDCKGQFATN